MDTRFPDGDLRCKNPELHGDAFLINLEKVEILKAIAQSYNTEVPYLVLAWYLAHPAIDVLIPGAKRAEQALGNLKTIDVHLAENDIVQIDKLFQD